LTNKKTINATKNNTKEKSNELDEKVSVRYRYRNFGDCYYRGRQSGRRNSHILPVELAHADNLRHQGGHVLAGVGHQLLGGDSLQEFLFVQEQQQLTTKQTLASL